MAIGDQAEASTLRIDSLLVVERTILKAKREVDGDFVSGNGLDEIARREKFAVGRF